MTQTVHLPLWLFVLILVFAAVTALSHFLLPSVRWFFRRRLERAVKRLNQRLDRPIEPFKLARRYDMIQRLIYDPEVSREIANYAQENGVPENVAFQKARSYAREIVPSFSAFSYFSFAMRVARILVNFVYRIETSDRNDAVMASVSKDVTPIFVMNHRSNMDYVLVTYLASRASALSYAVGEWARVWPLSWLIKSLGAYFIRRRSRGALYRKVLARYVQMATEGGVAQAMYPEGGLSLTGRLQKPKMGLLSYIVEGHNPKGRDIVFVPVGINYDRVLEDRVLIAAGERGDRRFGARMSVVVGFILRKLWQRVRGKDTRFGMAAVAFGEPLSLRDFGVDRDVDELSDALMGRIADVMPVPVVPMIARVLAQGPQATEALTQKVQEGLAQVPERNRVVKPQALADEVTIACTHLRDHGVLVETADQWRIQSGQENVATFYANSIAHYFDDDAAVPK